MADILEIKEVQWKPQAYRKAARGIESLSEDIVKIYKEGGINALREIPGVGEGIAKKIIEFVEKGKIKGYEKLKKSLPKGFEELMEVPSMGPKKVKVLSEKLKIKNIKDLERAAKQGKIRKLERFGEKSEEDILRGIDLVKKGKERMLLGKALLIARSIEEELKKLKEVKKISIGGSIRRRKETVKDIDILVVSSDPKTVMDFFTSMKEVKVVLAKGTTKSSVYLKAGLASDLRVVEEKSFGAALQYFTGNIDHNVKLREIAIKKGYKLNEYGLFNKKTGKYICGRTEQEVYKRLGLDYIEPELRTNTGEIDAAKNNKLPELIPYDSVKGDLHTHTVASDGVNTIEEMALAAKKIGYRYIAISDHSKSERIANGLDEKRLLKHLIEIEKADKKISGIHVLKASEVDILVDGSLDYQDRILKKLDFVTAAIHSRFKSAKDEMTERIIKAMKNRYVNAIGHPTGRLINARRPYDIDFEKICKAASENNVFLEINASPSRLDLNDSHIRTAIDYKVKFVISTDSHSTEQFKYMELGIAQARRGWASSRNIVNTLPFHKFRKLL